MSRRKRSGTKPWGQDLKARIKAKIGVRRRHRADILGDAFFIFSFFHFFIFAPCVSRSQANGNRLVLEPRAFAWLDI